MRKNKIIKQRLPQENLSVIIKNLVNYLNLKISFSAIDEAVESYKKYYSENLISLFKNWSISCELIQTNISELSGQKLPFIANMGHSGDNYVLVTNIENDSITFIDSARGIVKENIYIFEQAWSGELYMIEINPNSGEKDYKESIRNERRNFYKRNLSFVPIAIILPLLYFSGMKMSNNNLSWIPFLALQSIGILCSTMLLSVKYDNWIRRPRVLQELFHKTDLLNLDMSDYTLEKYIKTSEALMFYFIGGLLLTIFGIISNQLPSVLLTLAIINILFIPLVVFNFLNRNKYPPLFTYTNSIILIECLFTIFNISNSFELNTRFWLSLTISYSVPFIVWNSMKHTINRNIEMVQELEQLKYFKSPSMLWLLFNRRPYISIPRIKKELSYGNSYSNIQVIMFLSPTDSFSNYYFLFLKDVAQKHSNIRLSIRFNFLENYLSNYITELILTFATFNSSESTLDLIEKWCFNNYKDVTFWAEKCTLYNKQDPQVNELIEAHKLCSKKIENYNLPVILINNKIVPDFFEAEDIEYLIANHPAKNQTTTTTVKEKFWEDRRPIIV